MKKIVVFTILLVLSLAMVTNVEGTAPLFSDDFNDGNDDGWTQVNRYWHVKDGQYHLDGGYMPGWTQRGGYSFTHVDDPTWTDYIYELTFDTTNMGGYPPWVHQVFVFFRVVEPTYQTGYILNIWTPGDPSSATALHKVVGGQETLVDWEPAVAIEGTNTARIEVQGGHIQVYINDQLIIDCTDPDPIPHGGVGVGAIWEVNAWFDDIRISYFNEAPVASAGGPYAANEGETITLDGSGSIDSDGTIVDYEWDLDNDGEYDDASGVTTEISLAEDGLYSLGLKVTDNDGASDTDTTDININNMAPTINYVIAPSAAININDQPVHSTIAFSDPGTADTHEVTWDWGDGIIDNQPGVLSPASADHTYAQTGVYTLQITVTDDEGDADTATYQYIVVYDPAGDFVTGGGWIRSPVRDEILYMSEEGRANFGFISKYKPGANTPTGNTEFQFQNGDLNFHSSSYDWLVVTGGDSAKFKGTGKINGEGEFRFMLWAGDREADTFRIKIWEEDDFGNETVLYDNGTDQVIGGGSIVIHTKN